MGNGCIYGRVAHPSDCDEPVGDYVRATAPSFWPSTMSRMNVPTFYPYLIYSGFLLLAVLFDPFRRSKRVH
jgi:L-arabinose transport system permease protein